MTALIGGSLLLIVGASIALVIGWIGEDESLIWASIVSSVAAGVMLAMAYGRSKADAARRPAPARRADPPPRQPRSEPEPTQETAAVSSDDDRVVAYPDRSRFHRPDCRYASIPGGEKIAREAAVRRGYDPCGVCKP